MQRVPSVAFAGPLGAASSAGSGGFAAAALTPLALPVAPAFVAPGAASSVVGRPSGAVPRSQCPPWVPFPDAPSFELPGPASAKFQRYFLTVADPSAEESASLPFSISSPCPHCRRDVFIEDFCDYEDGSESELDFQSDPETVP